MAKDILCPSCENKRSKLSEKYGELFESLNGTAKKNMHCDVCDKVITTGSECFACVTLPSKRHPNYEIQKPVVWAHELINVSIEPVPKP